MKKEMMFGILALTMLTATGAKAATADACRAPALAAAEEEYGNEPDGTRVKTLIPGRKYLVTVGIGNPEDGAHDYFVTFANGCDSKPAVEEVALPPAHPLQAATHETYNQIFRSNDNELPATEETQVALLPRAAQKQANTWLRDGNTVKAFEINVNGNITYAVRCSGEVARGGNVIEGIVAYFLIYDAKGYVIDEAVAYGDIHGKISTQVGVNGITWQNMESDGLAVPARG